MRKTLLFSTALFFSVTAFGAIDALNFSSSQQEDDYHSLTQELRCPQCQNNNIADSNATIAVDMRGSLGRADCLNFVWRIVCFSS